MRNTLRPTHSIVRTLITLVISGCMGGTGSGLIGIATGNGSDNNGAPPVLSFFVQPNSSDVRAVISPSVQVLASDSLGGIDSTFTGSITISLGSNSTGGSLSGTTSVRAVNGIASFSSLSVDKAGTYTLQASASGSATVTSSSFSVTTVTTP